MADGKDAGTPDRGTTSRGQDEQLDARLSALGEKLKRKGALPEPEKEAETQDAPSGAAQAIKLSSEFLAAVIVGVVLGLGFDQLAGTSPWGLIIFLLLGFAAGVLNVLRSAGVVAPGAVGRKDASRGQEKGLKKPNKRG